MLLHVFSPRQCTGIGIFPKVGTLPKPIIIVLAWPDFPLAGEDRFAYFPIATMIGQYPSGVPHRLRYRYCGASFPFLVIIPALMRKARAVARDLVIFFAVRLIPLISRRTSWLLKVEYPVVIEVINGPRLHPTCRVVSSPRTYALACARQQQYRSQTRSE